MSEATVVVEFDANKITVFNEFEGKLAKLEKDNLAAVFDLGDKKGNAGARSHIWKLRQSKTSVDTLRKDTKAKALQFGNAVDEKAKTIIARVEAMIEVHAVPLKEFEEQEKKRVEELAAKLGALSAWRSLPLELDALTKALEVIESTLVDDSWGDYEGMGVAAQGASIKGLTEAIALKTKAKREQEELAELRKEKADREENDRQVQARKDEDKRKKDEIARKKREAEEQIERDKQAEIKRVAREKKIREEAAEQARIEAENIANAKLEKAKREKQEALDREKKLKEEAKQAKLDKIEADKQAKINIENARLAEIKRQKDKKAQEKAKLEKREADKLHVNSVMNKAKVALAKATGINLREAEAAILTIKNGDIPAVTISF